MTNQEAIETIEANYPSERYSMLREALNMAIALLKEQELVEPKVIIDTLVCGNCGTRLERQSMVGDNILFTERFDYCPHCGQEVRLENEYYKRRKDRTMVH